MAVGLVEHAGPCPAGESTDFDIFARRVLEVHDPGADRGDDGLGHDEGVAVAAVEALGDVAGELEVLALVVAHRHLVGVVEEDVGGHERRVGEQPGRDELGLVGLVLELGHALQLAEGGRALHQPAPARCARDVALHEQRADVGVEAGGQAAAAPARGSWPAARPGPGGR